MQNDPLPIPEKTKGRDAKYHDAARLFIHKRVTNIAEVARQCGIGNKAWLQQVRHDDAWDDFVIQLAALSIKSVWTDGSGLTAMFSDSKELILAERKQQKELIPKLEAERKKVMAVMEAYPAGTKAYSACVSALRTINAELERWTGIAAWLQWLEVQAKASLSTNNRAATPSDSTSSSNAARGTIVDV